MQSSTGSRLRGGEKVIGGAVLAVLLLVACTADDGSEDRASPQTIDPGPTVGSSSSAPSSTGVPVTDVVSPTGTEPGECTPPLPPPVRDGLDATVTVHLYCGQGIAPVDLQPVERVVPAQAAEDPLLASLEQLLIGATPAEARAGLSSVFSPYTAGAVRSVKVEAGVAVIDFEPAFGMANNFSTSNVSAVVLSQLKATIFQFPEISGIDLQIAGERFCGWENSCDGAAVPLIPRP